MWATLPNPNPPIKPTNMISLSKLPVPPPFSATHPRRGHRSSATSDGVAALGPAVLSVPDPTKPKQSGSDPQQKKNQADKEMSGSDILWALQKVSARKAQIKRQQQLQQKRYLKRREDPNVKRVVDYDKVRPVIVESGWVTRLDDLQRRLQDLLSF